MRITLLVLFFSIPFTSSAQIQGTYYDKYMGDEGTTIFKNDGSYTIYEGGCETLEFYGYYKLDNDTITIICAHDIYDLDKGNKLKRVKQACGHYSIPTELVNNGEHYAEIIASEPGRQYIYYTDSIGHQSEGHMYMSYRDKIWCKPSE